MSTPTPDRLGRQLSAPIIERAFLASVKKWLPDHLAHQERINDLPARSLKRPKQWLVRSEYGTDTNRQPPVVVVTCEGTIGEPQRIGNGMTRKVWRLQTVVLVQGSVRQSARDLGGYYLAALTGAAEQDRSLGGQVESCRQVGPDDTAFNDADQKSQRAIYGTAFQVTGRVLTPRVALTEPSTDPYDPDEFPPVQQTAEILVSLDPPE